MSLLQADTPIAEAHALRQENETLKDRLARLSQASISISESLEVDTGLQEVVNSA